jgi:hypothetical protein
MILVISEKERSLKGIMAADMQTEKTTAFVRLDESLPFAQREDRYDRNDQVGK